jgi:hypothetical protein
MLSSTTTQTAELTNAANYAITFPLAAATHIEAIVTVTATGATTTWTLGSGPSQFAFTPTTEAGRITSGTATTTDAVPAGSTIRFRRVTPRTQLFDVVQGSRFSAEALESALDKMTMILQEIERDYLAADVAIDARLDALEA